MVDGYDYLAKLTDFDQYLRFNELYEDKRITSGVYMCAVAIAVGYQDIYLTGIDFYTGGNTTYAFEHKQENIIKLAPDFLKEISQSSFHSQNTDLEALKFLQENYNVNIYSISPSSPISNYFPLSVQKNHLSFKLENKPEGYTKDILIPVPEAYYKFHQVIPKKEKKHKLHQNLIYRLIKDFLHLPNHIKHYVIAKRKKF